MKFCMVCVWRCNIETDPDTEFIFGRKAYGQESNVTPPLTLASYVAQHKRTVVVTDCRSPDPRFPNGSSCAQVMIRLPDKILLPKIAKFSMNFLNSSAGWRYSHFSRSSRPKWWNVDSRSGTLQVNFWIKSWKLLVKIEHFVTIFFYWKETSRSFA